VEAILDAAAAIIGESGLEGLTVHGTARRAGTSIGSMYHFFPDLDAVIGALIDRHQRGLEALMSALAARDPREWSRMSAAAAADAIVTPIFSYVSRHPDISSLNTSPRSAARFGKRIEAMRNTGFDIIDRILAARNPTAPPDVRRARTAVVMGTVEGVATGLDRVKAKQARVVEELTRAVTAYLETMG
jgi:AcrR family transcriptional regulator